MCASFGDQGDLGRARRGGCRRISEGSSLGNHIPGNGRGASAGACSERAKDEDIDVPVGKWPRQVL